MIEYLMLHPGQSLIAWLAIGVATYCIFIFVFKIQPKSPHFVGNCLIAWPVAWLVAIITAIQVTVTFTARRVYQKWVGDKK